MCHFVAKVNGNTVLQEQVFVEYVAKIKGNPVLLEGGFIENVAKIHGNALCGKSQWKLSFK